MLKHLIVRAETRNPGISIEDASNWIKRLVLSLKQEIVSNICFYESDHELSVTVLVKSGHVVLHLTKPTQIMQLDICCDANFSAGQIMPFVQEFSPFKIWYKFINREQGLHEIDNSFQNMEYFGKGLSWTWYEE